MHVSTQIRDHFKSVLAAGVAAVDGRVAAGEPDPFTSEQAPAIVVGAARTRTTATGRGSGGLGQQDRSIEIPVLVLDVDDGGDVAASLLEIATEIECSVFSEAFVELLDDDLVLDVSFTGDNGIAEYATADENGVFAGLTLLFTVIARTPAGRADVSIFRS